jgi:glucose/arabinose dehydrogenase
MGVGATTTPAGGARVACATDLVGITSHRASAPPSSPTASAPRATWLSRLTATSSSRSAIAARPRRRGGFRDSDRDGRADVQPLRRGGGTGIAVANGYLTSTPRRRSSAIHSRPAARALGSADTPTGLPTGGHGSRTFVIDGNALLVDVGSRTNSCQVADRQLESPGIPDCPELETRAGIWQFDANRLNQTQAQATRFATGIRNGVAFTKHPTTGELYAMQHGRDQLHDLFPDLYDAKQSAELPAECMY